jgi:catechol 2,3-dioxygenase-like lactoylglutathione lyase family enzyme
MAPRGMSSARRFLVHDHSRDEKEAAMQVTGLFHVAIKTNDLDATVKFYTEVLGMKLVHRPDFGFPGAWIAAGDDVPIIHIYAGGPALLDGKTPYGTAALDHVSLTIKGWDECLERVKRLGYDWRAAIVPGTSLWQIFVHDPSGVMMELTFDGKAENRPTPEIPADRVYMAGQPFGTARAKAA